MAIKKRLENIREKNSKCLLVKNDDNILDTQPDQTITNKENVEFSDCETDYSNKVKKMKIVPNVLIYLFDFYNNLCFFLKNRFANYVEHYKKKLNH